MNREEEIRAANPYGYSSDTAYGKMIGFTEGAQWADKNPKFPWVSVNEQLPEDNENIIILCEHGAIFNGAFCNDVWFCMDGYIKGTYNGNPIYSSMSSIPPMWKPIAWMPMLKFEK